MEAATQSHQHQHHEMPTSGRALNALAVSATLHCLTGCAIGEVIGMAIGTALGFSELGTIALAVALAFLFGYALTSLPLLRAGLAFSVVVPIALASDTFSIAVMEIVDNAIMLIVPGAMEGGLGDILFWGALSFALAIAFVFAVPVNRYLLARGKGHARVHETGIHGGPPVRLVGALATLAFLFGSTVLVAEAFNSDGGGHGGGHADMGGSGGSGARSGDQDNPASHEQKGGMAERTADPDPVRGLSSSEAGLSLELQTGQLRSGRRGELRYRIVKDGAPLRDFEVEHEKRMHLIVVRRDMTGFQHLHPRLESDDSWSTALTLSEPGRYRAFADFKTGRENRTLAEDLRVTGGEPELRELPAPANTASAGGAYRVTLDSDKPKAGRESELSFTVSRAGQTVTTEPYLGAGGHLVALRQGDLAFLHVHPSEHASGHAQASEQAVSFDTQFPSAGSYRLFLQFKHAGKVRTAAFTREVAR